MKKTHEIIASMQITNTIGLQLHSIEYGINDYVIISDNIMNRPRKYRLYYTEDGAYFNCAGSRNYMYNFIYRTN